MKKLAAFLGAVIAALGVSALQQTASAQPVYEDYTFTTFAGPSQWDFLPLDGLGTAARFDSPGGLAQDANGNIYISDRANNTIRKMTPDGQITTLAGLAGTSGTNDGIGAAARFFGPNGLAVDSNGNVYVADTGNSTIRKITPAGKVTTVAGLPGVAGKVNGTGSAARFNNPFGLTISGTNIYVADAFNDAIRLLTANGVVTTFAGTLGVPGSADKTGTAATFNEPTGIAADSAGNFYVTDTGNDTLRKISPTAVVTTLAGSATNGPGSNNGTNGTAEFNTPLGVTVDAAGNIYVTDTSNDTIRKVTPAGVVTTLAGGATISGDVDATATAARFNQPFGIVVDANTNLYVADFGNDVIRKVDPNAVVTTIAGSGGGSGTTDGTASQARFNLPAGAAVDTNGNVFIADEENQTIREITPAGIVSTFAGTAGVAGSNDATGLAATFNHPVALAFDQNDNLFVADSVNDTIRMITPAGVVSTFAGSPGQSGTNDAVGTNALFFEPLGLTVDSSNNVYVADTQNGIIREITPAGVVSTLPGKYSFPEGIAVDPDGNVFFGNDGDSTIREITPAGVTSTVAGLSGVTGSSDGVGTNATFDSPFGLTIDNNRNLYVVDTDNETIRKITPAGAVTTLAGVPTVAGYVDATGDQALFDTPEGIAVDPNGNLYVVDARNESIRIASPALTDRPTVDLLGARVGVQRHFAVTNSTATSWSWSLLRQPSSSSAQIIGANTATPTFTPDVEDIYIVRFQASDNSGHSAIRTMTLYADNTPPTIAITNPVVSTISSNGVFTVAGTATDNLGVSNIFVQVNGGPWTNATGTTNWAVDVPLVGGTNVIQAYSQDFAGNVSPTNQVRLPYIVSGRLVALTKGGGSLKPNLNGVLLQIGSTYSITAKPVPGSTFSNWSSSLGGFTNSETITFVMQSNLTLTANFLDHERPTVLITSPRTAKFASNATFTVTGTAKDNDRVATVFYQLNGGAWTNATGTTNWTAQVSLAPGANTILAYSQDPSGNNSTTNHASLTYVPSAQMTISKNGQGTVTPNFNGGLLAIGTNYTMTAKAATGFIFSNWVDNAGNLLTASPAFSFAMLSNTTVGVNFTRNMMFWAQGNYAGLFYDTNNLTATNAGFFSAAVTPTGGFTAKMLLGGSTISTSGQFSPDGVYSNSIAAKGFTSPLTVQLQLDLTGGDQITGTIGDSAWSDSLIANQDIFSATNPPSQLYQRFTLVIPGAQDSSVQPGGSSFGSIVLDGAGNVTFTGMLADGSPASQKTFLSKDGQWPFYISSAGGQGVLLGWLTFSPGQKGTLGGQVYWDRLPQATAALYPSGFNFTNVETVGSFYQFFIGKPTLVLTNGDGIAVLQQAGLSPDLTNSFTLNTRDIATGTNNLKLTITITTGLFKGTIVNPANNISIPVNGVVLTNQNAGYGFFINGNQSGSVFIGTNQP